VTATAMPGPVVWYGGKGHLVKHLVPLLPEGKVYVEPYGGAASLLFSKPPSQVEVYNDLHGDLVTLFRVLRDQERFPLLHERLTLTLKSRAEYEQACSILADPESDDVARAWAFFVAMNQGYGGTYPTPGRWSRDKGQRVSGGMSNNVAQWWRRIAWLGEWHERLARVQVERRDALDLIREFDSPDTVFYLDPPYVPETRVNPVAYRHEQPIEHHERLVGLLLGIEGQAVLSGYDHAVYAPLVEARWEKVTFQTAVRGAGTAKTGRKARVETAWVRRNRESQMELGV
jgi:DNA adenine methylase